MPNKLASLRTFAALPAVALAASLIAGCAPPEGVGEGASPLIVGSNDLRILDASVPAVASRYTELQHGVGNFHRAEALDGHQCTASYLGGGVAMTAGHCFGAGSTEQQNVLCPGVTVDWSNVAGGTPYLKSTCQRVLRMRNASIWTDYAFFEVFPQPDRVLAVNTAAGGSSAAPSRGTILSHPAGRALSWSGTCALTTPYGTYFPHTCDTEPGSSGAPIFDDSSLRIVGINLGNDGSTLNYGRYLSATPAATVLAGRAGWQSGVTVLSATTTFSCGGVLSTRNDVGEASQRCNGRRSCSVTTTSVPWGCTATNRSVSFRCAESGGTIATGTNAPMTIASYLSCLDGVTATPPSWTTFVSEEGGGPSTTCERATDGRNVIQVTDGVGCRGGYCDDVSLRCPTSPTVALDQGSAFWTPFFSEEQPAQLCPSGYYVTGARCRGSSCDDLSLMCVAGNRRWGACAWSGVVSDEQSSATCPAGRYLAGAQCSGSKCDNVSLYCCAPL